MAKISSENDINRNAIYVEYDLAGLLPGGGLEELGFLWIAKL